MVWAVSPVEPLVNECAIVQRAQKGDRRAFEQIYRAYAKTLYSYVLVPILGDVDDAQDCVRETFIAAHRALPNYEWRAPSIYPWLKTLAKNKARDLLRASGRRQRLRGAFYEHLGVASEAANNPMEENLARLALREDIEATLDKLKPRYGRVIRLRLLEDRSRETCAELLEVKIGTLDVLLFRAIRAFREQCAGK